VGYLRGSSSWSSWVRAFSPKGDCWDNAVVESFFHTLKVELILGKVYDFGQEAKTDIFDYIEIFYNQQRRHF